MKPGSDMPCGAASSLTPWLPSPNAASTPRRVGSASAVNTRSRTGSEYLTMWFSIRRRGSPVKPTAYNERCLSNQSPTMA
jgi:hypothetical protein